MRRLFLEIPCSAAVLAAAWGAVESMVLLSRGAVTPLSPTSFVLLGAVVYGIVFGVAVTAGSIALLLLCRAVRRRTSPRFEWSVVLGLLLAVVVGQYVVHSFNTHTRAGFRDTYGSLVSAVPLLAYFGLTLLIVVSAIVVVWLCGVLLASLRTRRAVRAFVSVVGVVLVVWAVVAGLSRRSPTADRDGPNVVLITLDALRADHLSCYGYERTVSPNIDELAAEGVQFADCVSAAPYTHASLPSIVTSTYPSAHGVLGPGWVLDDAYPTLAELLREDGYRTLFVTDLQAFS
jgi:glucan phosphoethanolaminetransferase (alkaline phosphatase superfamily)